MVSDAKSIAQLKEKGTPLSEMERSTCGGYGRKMNNYSLSFCPSNTQHKIISSFVFHVILFIYYCYTEPCCTTGSLCASPYVCITKSIVNGVVEPSCTVVSTWLW